MVNHPIRINNVSSPFNNVKILRISPKRKMIIIIMEIMVIIILIIITTRHLHAHLIKIRANKISIKIIKVRVRLSPKLTWFSRILTRNPLSII